MVERTQFGKYSVVAKIGQGAMGDVYKAHDAILDRHVALKTIAASLGASPDAPLLFHLGNDLSESQNVAEKHPETVRQLKDRLNGWRNQLPKPRW